MGVVSRGLRPTPPPRLGNLLCCGRNCRLLFAHLDFRTSSWKFLLLLCPSCFRTAKIVPESVQHQEKMLLGVTSELHAKPLVPQMETGSKPNLNVDFLVLPFGILVEVFYARNLETCFAFAFFEASSRAVFCRCLINFGCVCLTFVAVVGE